MVRVRFRVQPRVRVRIWVKLIVGRSVRVRVSDIVRVRFNCKAGDKDRNRYIAKALVLARVLLVSRLGL
jgi:hypothetical protein